jgi:hypothetical protein
MTAVEPAASSSANEGMALTTTAHGASFEISSVAEVVVPREAAHVGLEGVNRTHDNFATKLTTLTQASGTAVHGSANTTTSPNATASAGVPILDAGLSA